MTKFEKLVDDPFSYIGVCLAFGIVGFSIGFLIGSMY